MVLTFKTKTMMDPIINLLDEGKAKDSLTQKRYWYRDSEETFDLEVDDLSLDEVKRLRDYLKSLRFKKYVTKLNSYIAVFEDINQEKIESLDVFCSALRKFIKNMEHKWIFLSDKDYSFLVPYLIYNVVYYPDTYDRDGYLIEEHVTMEIHTNNIDGFSKKLINFNHLNICNKTIPESLLDKGFVVETKELIDDYNTSKEKYLSRLDEFKKQYKAASCYKGKDDHWYFQKRKESPTERDTKQYFRVVNSCKCDNRHIEHYENCCICPGEKLEVPVLPFIPVFNLDKHQDMFCHVDDIEDYIYDKTLKDKLILPESHKNLLDILVNSIDVIRGDIIDNKGNGTVIILEGPPGCGKTLSTEVYSEILEKPLYRVSTGQLGIDPNTIDDNLRKVLNRAERLDCLLLIDECETFVRSRGTDLQQNAIVTTFLRTIEYFDGIMFLTSNKINDIDDAILSRCAAAVSYKAPNEENSKKIWKVLLKQFDLEDSVSDKTINEAVKVFPNAVGRDIKELIKLTARYCKSSNIDMDIHAFVSCAQFRYLEIDDNYYKSLKD